jgi:hypothetical protein
MRGKPLGNGNWTWEWSGLGKDFKHPSHSHTTIGWAPSQKANVGYEAMGVHTNTVVILGHGFQLES